MQERHVGRSGLRVSRLGLGTSGWGPRTDEHTAREVLGGFVEAGGTLVDTAANYGGGRSEEILGTLVGPLVRRDDLVLASKAGLVPGARAHVPDTSRRTLLRQLDASLARLGTDHLDLWQVHVWSDAVPLEETLDALDHAVRTGRARYVGVSNYTGWQTALAHARQDAAGRSPLVSAQVEYSLVNRDAEHEVVPAAAALGVGVLAWSPLGRGVLTGKYRRGIPADSRAASEQMSAFVEPYLDETAGRVVEAVARAAEGLDLSPSEVALAWVRDRPGVAAALVGPRTVEQLQGALSTEAVTLPTEIADALEDVSSG